MVTSKIAIGGGGGNPNSNSSSNSSIVNNNLLSVSGIMKKVGLIVLKMMIACVVVLLASFHQIVSIIAQYLFEFSNNNTINNNNSTTSSYNSTSTSTIIGSNSDVVDDEKSNIYNLIRKSSTTTMDDESLNKKQQQRMNILLLGGRAPVCLDYLRLFSEMGHSVHLVESPTYRPLFVSNLSKYAKSVRYFSVFPNCKDCKTFQKELIEICKELKIDIVIPTCEEVFHVARAKSQIEKETSTFVFCEPLENLRELHNKFDFVEYIRKNEEALNNNLTRTIQVKQPETILINHLITDSELINFWNSCNGQVVLKPCYSRFASQTIVNPSYEHYMNIVKNGNVCGSDSSSWWVAQQFIDGQIVCSFGVAQKGKLLAHCAYLGGIHTPNGTPVGSSVYFEQISNDQIDTSLRSWISSVVSHRNFTGQISFDFIISSSTTIKHKEEQEGSSVVGSDKQLLIIYPIECNPRATSGAHLFNTDHVDRSKFIQCFFPLESKTMGGGVDSAIDKGDGIMVPPFGSKSQLLGGMIITLFMGCSSLSSVFSWLQDVMKCGVEKDALFKPNDFMPFFLQAYFALDPMIKVLRYKVNLISAMTFDIEWNGEDVDDDENK